MRSSPVPLSSDASLSASSARSRRGLDSRVGMVVWGVRFCSPNPRRREGLREAEEVGPRRLWRTETEKRRRRAAMAAHRWVPPKRGPRRFLLILE